MNLLPRVGDTYQIIRELGAGSGGTVYLAYHNRLQKNVVLKLLKTKALDLLDARAETDILKNLHHPSLPQVFDFIETTDESGETAIYTVMDFIPGDTLNEYLIQGRTFTPAQVAKYMMELTDAVRYLHSQKTPILHGDIKPSNIMLTPDDHIVLIDFNISGFSDTQEFVACTKEYAPPEQREAVKQNRERRRLQKKAAGAVEAKAQMAEVPVNSVANDVTEGSAFSDDATEIADVTEIDDAKEVAETSFVNDATEVEDGFSETEEGELPMLGLDFKPVALIDQRSDLYSIGAAMFPLVTGEKPGVDYDKRRNLASRQLPISEGLVYVIDKAMELKPEKRFQSAEQMLEALRGIGKKDKRYRNLFIREVLFILLFVSLGAGSAITAFFGWETMKQERADECYAQAEALYEARSYEEALLYILVDALADPGIYDKNTLANLYYMAANTSYELGEYSGALEYYELAVLHNSTNVEYYCNYAIALIKAGQMDKAEQIIQLAERMGLEQAQLYLMKGELAAMSGNPAMAEENFRRCATESQDPYLTLRSFVLNSELYTSYDGYAESVPAIETNLKVLHDGEQVVDEMYLPVIWGRQLEAYLDLYHLNTSAETLNQAATTGEKLIQAGQKSFDLYLNLGMIYDYQGNYEGAMTTYQSALDAYGENYILYKRMALLEISIQDARPSEGRQYDGFVQYMARMEELILAIGVQADADMEIQQLRDYERSLRETGWLK